MTFGTVSLAAPHAASSRVSRYSRTDRRVLAMACQSTSSDPAAERCLLASAAIRLESTAKAAPSINPSAMQRRTTFSNSDGQQMFEHAAKLNWEGIISKRADAPYQSERNESWLKIKAVQKGKFPVVGFIKDPSGVAALYLGKQEGRDLVYMGKVGTGWSRTVSSQIRKQLDTVVSPKSKLTKPLKKPKATWVEPRFVADIEFRDITSEGLLRASSFKGLSKGTGRT